MRKNKPPHQLIIAETNTNWCGDKSGFTLIEAIMAAVIFSFIGAGLAFTFLSGIRLWERARNTDFAQTQRILCLEALGGELRQSLDIALIGFEGNDKEFSFPTQIGDSIFKVTYRFDPGKNMLVRRQVAFSDILAGSGGEKYVEKEVFALDGLSLEYFYFDRQGVTYLWKEDWLKSDGTFIAVRLRMSTKDGKAAKTVFIPVA